MSVGANVDGITIEKLFSVCHSSLSRSQVVILSFYCFIFSGLVYSIYWWDKHNIFVSLGSFMNVLLGIIIKEVLGVPRVVVVEGYGLGHSMPSGHAFLLSFLVFYYSFVFHEATKVEESNTFLLRTRIGLANIYLLWISFEKVNLGHNNWYDITSGWMLGLLYALMFVHLMSKIIEGDAEIAYTFQIPDKLE